jgi:hypothetical protein
MLISTESKKVIRGSVTGIHFWFAEPCGLSRPLKSREGLELEKRLTLIW